MIRVFVVEDEPAAMRALVSVIESKCPDCRIAGTAENGREALDRIRENPPDIVVTDIRMPIMDGLALTEAVRSEFPEIFTILLSGVQEFSYAQKAIRFGVSDYLLKPVQLQQLQGLLTELGRRKADQDRQHWMELLDRLLAEDGVEASAIPEQLRRRRFQLALICENGLPSRFSSGRAVNAELERRLNAECGEDDWFVQGRDAREWVLAHATDLPVDRELMERVQACTARLTGGFHTVVVHPAPLPVGSLGATVRMLRRELDASIVPGMSAVHRHTEERMPQAARLLPDDALLRRIGAFLSQERYDEMKEELVRAFAVREEERLPLLALERDMRGIVELVSKQTRPDASQLDQIERVMDEMIRHATSFGDLMAQLWDLLSMLLRRPEKTGLKADSEDFLSGIVRYLEEHMAEPVTLTQICQHFSISQTYISRLFRKHYHSSVIEYLTGLRMESAKRILGERRGLPLREVAAMVGYADPLYFSRAFKAYAGMPPSEYGERPE